MSTIFNDLHRELDPFIVDIEMTLIQGEKIQLKFALNKELDAIITLHENIVLHFQHFLIARDKKIVSIPIYVDYELLPVHIQNMILPTDNILCVMPGDPILQEGDLINALDKDRDELKEVLKQSYFSRKRKFERINNPTFN